MKKILSCTAFGFGLAAVCGYAELAYLSASLITLTVFCAAQATLVVTIQSFSHAVRNRA